MLAHEYASQEMRWYVKYHQVMGLDITEFSLSGSDFFVER